MSEHKLEMCQRILKVLLCASFLAGRVGGEDGWFSSWGADTPDTAPGGLSDFDRDFQGFAFGFNNPHSDGGSNHQSKQETVNPFVSKIFPKSTFQNAYVNQPIQAADPTRRITVHNDIKNPPYHRSPTPVQHYAPNYNQPRGQNQKYAVPNNGPQNNENGYGLRPHVTGRYRENAIPLTSGEIHPQYKQPYNEPNKVFTPYANVNSHLNRYENDPILDKVKDDVNANELRLKKNERVPSKHVDEEVDESDEDSSEETDEVLSRNQQNENFQPQYENYYPQNKPTYYEKPTNPTSDQRNINKYVVYPRHNHENIKIHPDAYQPLKDEISVLKQNQGNTFGGERVEYPEQKPEDEETSDENIAPDGQDIFERQKNAFDSVNANFEPNFNQFTDDHHPRAHVILEHTGSSGEDENNSNSDESDIFIPVKMYAQVRHTDTTKHLPRDAAYQDAVTYDDVINAPRLREAIKSTKAQTVYTEEGYEDGAYDHAGHLKHASNHEAHGARAGGKQQGGGTHRDSGRQSYDDGGRSKHGSDVTHGKKWDVDEGNREDFDDHENYSLKDGNHAFSVHDLTQAGSEKLGAQNTTFAPFNNPKISKKIVMMSTIEKRYEDVLRPEDLDGNKEDDRIYYKRLGDEHTRHQVLIGDYLQKTKQFNSYIPHLLYKLHGSKPKKTKSKDDQKPAHSDVEVFKTNFKMNEGPRHGGNYKQIPIKNSESEEWPKRNDNIAKKNNIHRTENENGNDQNRNTHKNKEFLPERIVLKNANDSFEESSPPLVSEVSSESSEASAEENNEELVAFSNEPKILLERITTPERFDRRYNSNEDASSQENYDTKENAYAPRLERLEVLPRSGNSSAGYKDDQFPITSDVEVFRADFKKNKGPKHGGNYRKYSGEKRKRFREASELDDLNSFDDSTRSYLHGGNYRTSDDGSPKVDSDDVSESLVSGDYLDSNSTTY